MTNFADIIAQSRKIPTDTWSGRSANANADRLEKKLRKRNPDQRSIALSVNILEQLIANFNGTPQPILILS